MNVNARRELVNAASFAITGRAQRRDGDLQTLAAKMNVALPTIYKWRAANGNLPKTRRVELRRIIRGTTDLPVVVNRVTSVTSEINKHQAEIDRLRGIILSLAVEVSNK